MTDFVFKLLEMVGFTHPIHPALTHIPMGMVMGAFFFGLGGLVLKKTEFFRTATHCTGLGLIFIVPTIFAGYLDWQHRYGGEWETLIIVKMVLAGILTCLLAAAFLLGRKEETDTKVLMGLYVLCLFCAIGLGFSGGQLQYG
jgi:uncharacterized membrane protein